MLRLEIGVTQSTSTSAPRTCPALPVQTADCTLQTLQPSLTVERIPEPLGYAIWGCMWRKFFFTHMPTLHRPLVES